MVLRLDQRRAALDLQLGELDLRLVARDLGLGAFDRDLERPLVDGEQQVAGLDELAVAEMQLVDEARDARPHLDRGHASKRPENSSHWVTRLATGGEMVTGMAGGPPWAKAADEVTRKARPAAASRRRCKGKRELPRERFAARHMWL